MDFNEIGLGGCDMIDVILNPHDKRLVDMYLTLYNTAKLYCLGDYWVIETTERNIELKTYKSFIRFIEDEVKESLLTYAFNNELGELIEL